MPDSKRYGWQIYFWPLIVNLLSLVGIISALVGRGAWDIISWITLGGISGALTLKLFSQKRVQ